MHVLHWFRKGLRLHDNPALLASLNPPGLKSSGDEVIELYFAFVLDPTCPDHIDMNKRRCAFLLESLRTLDESLKAINEKFRLLVFQGLPEKVLVDACKILDVRFVTFEKDTEPYSKERDTKICKLFTDSGIHFNGVSGHTLWDCDWLFSKAMLSTAGTASPMGGGPSLAQKLGVPLTYQSFCSLVKRVAPQGPAQPLPSLTEYIGTRVRAPNLDSIRSTFGRLTCTIGAPSSPAECGLGPFEDSQVGCDVGGSEAVVDRYELLFPGGEEEALSRLERMGNPICRQIPWGHDTELLSAWREARTGFPFIDAAMTQLHRHGWMHHLARHSVACFLTRGQLWQSWQKGAAVFQRLLLDADWALNSANWMWLSASAFFHAYFRVYCPVGFGRKTDPEGKFIRHFLPCLKNMPKKYIYEPWKAPLEIQKVAGCLIGVDYPKPIVDHQAARKANLVKMRTAYAAGAPLDAFGMAKRHATQEEDCAEHAKKAK